MKLIGLIETDYVNYKKVSTVLEFPYCNFKCGRDVCHNSTLSDIKIIDVDVSYLIQLYGSNPLTKAIIFQGFEPLDSFSDVIEFIESFRENFEDDIVIYTGYELDEIADKVEQLKTYKNIILKVGRYKPELDSTFDSTLGINLASNNQFAITL